MTKKEFLKQYLKAKREIEIKSEQISDLKDLATKITQTLAPDKVKSTSDNRLESTVSKIVDIEKEIYADIDNLKKFIFKWKARLILFQIQSREIY